ncbi:MAG: hypothetical protein KF912_06385 [Phycisphaeraceae bacterium]|nr:hypothetical protein [Phycisphaeraceae bacterium]MBX3366927.1 hypothetical protein [Phycisphaeraceae bacterium]
MKTRKSAADARPAKTPKLRPMTDIPLVAALRDKVIEFENAGYRLLSKLHEAESLYTRFGRPESIDFPACADRRRAMEDAVRSTYGAAGEECPVYSQRPWCEFLEEFPVILSTFHGLGQGILQASEPLDYVIDGPEVPVTQRLIPALKGLTRQAMSHVHPVVYGEDGMGFFRQSAVPIPAKFAPLLDEIVAWRMLLEAAKQPPRQGWPTGVTARVLKEVGHIGDTTFIDMCNEAGVKRGKSGSHAHRFRRADIRKLIAAGRASERQKWNDAADSWAQEFGLESGG